MPSEFPIKLVAFGQVVGFIQDQGELNSSAAYAVAIAGDFARNKDSSRLLLYYKERPIKEEDLKAGLPIVVNVTKIDVDEEIRDNLE
jgi:hypothetical protein